MSGNGDTPDLTDIPDPTAPHAGGAVTGELSADGDQILSALLAKPPQTSEYAVVVDFDACDEFEKLRLDLGVADGDLDRLANDATSDAAAIKAARDKVDELDAQVTAEQERLLAERKVIVFKFRGIGGAAIDKLVTDNPPTPSQRRAAEAAGQQMMYDKSTFEPALVHACLTEPRLSLDQVRVLFKSDNFNQTELGMLVAHATQVNQAGRNVNVGKGSGVTSRSAR